jgi:AmiR/NasT family two-component response regulator
MGILMASHKITDAEAFDRLRMASQNANQKIRDVAGEVMLTC